MIHDLYPDLAPMNTILERLEYELTIYRHQRFIQKKALRDAYSYMTGCAQLAGRIVQELTALCSMERMGKPDTDQFLRLRCIGLEIPDQGIPLHHNTEEDNIVTNYHLKQLLDSREFLLRLLQDKDTPTNT